MFVFAFLIRMLHLHVSTNVNHDDVIKRNHFPREGNPPGESWIPPQRPVTRSFDVSVGWCASKQTFEQTVEMPFILTNKWKTKRLGRPPKVHYFSAFSVRRLGDGCRLLGVTKGKNVFFSVNTLWVNIAESLTDVNDITYVQNCKPLDCPISYIAPSGRHNGDLSLLRKQNDGIFHIEIESANIYIFSGIKY